MWDRRERHPPARIKLLRSLQSIDDAEPATRRAIELWAEGRSAWAIDAETGIPPQHLAALADSPAAQAHYTQVRAERDAARVDLAAVVPWLELWQALRRTKPR